MRILLASALLLGAVPAAAATVSVTIRGADGRPLAGAVVQVASARAPAAATGFTGPFVVAQKDIAFSPHVLIVPVGASVSFPNRDRVRHHVYSVSAPKRFELKLYGRDETRAVIFDRPGVVALGCNIHDSMAGFIVVVSTPYAAQTDAAGVVRLEGVPPGPVTLSAWHPSLRSPGNTMMQAQVVPAAGLAATLMAGRR